MFSETLCYNLNLETSHFSYTIHTYIVRTFLDSLFPQKSIATRAELFLGKV